MSTKQVWKYALHPSFDHEMPNGAKLLHVAAQNEEVCVWALVDPKARKVKRRLVVHGTGHTIEDDPGLYVGSAHIMPGSLVFHVFDHGEV